MNCGIMDYCLSIIVCKLIYKNHSSLIFHHSSKYFMFLVFTLVLIVVAVGILTSVYSIFFPFMQNL